MVAHQSRLALLGTTSRRETEGCERDLHHRERLLGCGCAGGRWARLRYGSGGVPAELSDAVATCDGGQRAGAWIFFMELDGQFRVGRWLHEPLWNSLC